MHVGMTKFLLLLMILSSPDRVYGWGARSHSAVCEASTFLISHEELRKTLIPLGYVLTHLCLIPDTDWKNDTELGMRGSATHYFNSGKSGHALNDVPLKYSEILKTGITHDQLGSSWWRAEQFYRRAIQNGKKNEVPKMIHDLGLMGHFIADNSNTFHIHDDFDGFSSGHGGIHDYYETLVPALYGPDFVASIHEEAKKIAAEKPAFLQTEDLILAMKLLAIDAQKDQDFLFKTDPILKPSTGKTPALRKDPEAVKEIWKPVILRSLARSALLQAKFIDLAYRISGTPRLKTTMRFPFRMPYVEPDYLK